MTEKKWTNWNGGKFLPVPEQSIGDVRLRCGKVLTGIKAGDVLWGRAKREVAANDNDSNGGEIVAYCFEGEAA